MQTRTGFSKPGFPGFGDRQTRVPGYPGFRVCRSVLEKVIFSA